MAEILYCLIAYCQRESVLPSDSSLYKELADICGCDAETIEDILEGIA